MPTVAERLRQVTLKVERAKEHSRRLEEGLTAFFATNPYGVSCKQQPESRRPVYFVSRADAIPDSISLIAGDVIQNLMSALDHLAYQLVCSDTTDRPPNPDWIYFPVRSSADEYHAKKRGKMQGAADETFALIDSVQPYKGGNDLLWTLYKLNTIEKHRLLLTVGAQAAGIQLGPLLAGAMSRERNSNTSAEIFEWLRDMPEFLMPADKGFPMKEGFELYIGAVDEQPDPNMKFRFMVALDEPGIVDGKPLADLLQQLVSLVEGVVTTMAPRLKDTR